MDLAQMQGIKRQRVRWEDSVRGNRDHHFSIGTKLFEASQGRDQLIMTFDEAIEGWKITDSKCVLRDIQCGSRKLLWFQVENSVINKVADPLDTGASRNDRLGQDTP